MGLGEKKGYSYRRVTLAVGKVGWILKQGEGRLVGASKGEGIIGGRGREVVRLKGHAFRRGGGGEKGKWRGHLSQFCCTQSLFY